MHSLEKVDSRTPVTFLKDLKSREGSPAIDELEQRLGILKSREGSPVLEELTQRLNAVLNRTPRDPALSMSPSTSHLNKDDRASSPLSNRILQRKKSATLITSRHRADSVDILSSDADSLAEAKTSGPHHAIRTESAYEDNVPSSTRPSFDAIQEMKNRIMNQVTSSPSPSSDSVCSPDPQPRSMFMNSPVSSPSLIPRLSRVSGSPRLRHALSTSSLSSPRASWTPSTPDLIPDVSDTLTQSSGPSSPPTFSPQVYPRDDFGGNQAEQTPIKDAALERPTSGMVTPKSRD